jgi:acyl-CoA synthetase (AMP-forming)/AMP-acid ligase II
MTTEYVRYHALRRPDVPAIDYEGRVLSYRQLAAELAQLVSWLKALEIGEGSVVVISCQNSFLQLMLMLAFESLRTLRAPVAAPCTAPPGSWLHGADLIVSDTAVTGLAPERHLLIGMDWYAMVLAAGTAAPLPIPASHPEGPDVILSTSGTTGTAKRILLTQRMWAGRIRERIWQYQLSHSTVFLVATPLSVGVVLTTVLSCLELGAQVVFDDKALIAGRLDRISHVVLLPVHLRRLLDAMPESQGKPHDLLVVSIGAVLTNTLRRRVLDRLASTLIDNYGSNEVGPICAINDEGAGAVLPGVEVRIEDSHRRVLPYGELGLVAARGPWMCHGYLGEPIATAQKFVAGWFYPGDQGILHGPEQLEIVGRADELLNIGGLKVAPAALEDALARRLPGVDIAVCAIAGLAGVDEICVALAGWTGSNDDLVPLVKEVLGPDFGTIHVVPVDVVPRTAAGKVQRAMLRSVLADLCL